MVIRDKVCNYGKIDCGAFKAQIDVYGHRFFLVYVGEIKEYMLDGWFDSIMEVLNIGTKK